MISHDSNFSQRNFGYLAVLGFSTTILITWEGLFTLVKHRPKNSEWEINYDIQAHFCSPYKSKRYRCLCGMYLSSGLNNIQWRPCRRSVWVYLRLGRHRCNLRYAVRNGVDVSTMYRKRAMVQTDRCRAPTSGGQYHWCSMLASPRASKFSSYVTGMTPKERETKSDLVIT
jgi:hypothetical protein